MVKPPEIRGLAEVSNTICAATWSVRYGSFFLPPVKHLKWFYKGIWTSLKWPVNIIKMVLHAISGWIGKQMSLGPGGFSDVGGFRFCPLLWQVPLFHGSIIFILLLCEHQGKSFEGFVCHLHHFPLVKTGLGSWWHRPDSGPVVGPSISSASSWMNYTECQQHYFYRSFLEVIKRYDVIVSGFVSLSTLSYFSWPFLG